MNSDEAIEDGLGFSAKICQTAAKRDTALVSSARIRLMPSMPTAKRYRPDSRA